MASAVDTDEQNIELWKIRRLIKTLQEYQGNGTSMISIYIPQKGQIPPLAKKLTDEMGAAQNIKSRVNRQSVITAITSVQAKLKLYNRVPTNGLVIFCGEIQTEDGKEKKVNIDFEPFQPMNSSLYLCDSKFHTEALSGLLVDDLKFGFIVMDGNGALFGTIHGNVREVLMKFQVDLPKKHGRGGQSAPRFARIRLERRHNYLRKVAETAAQLFLTNDKCNVCGLVLAGSADFKTELSETDMFDQRLKAKILQIVDISYGGENGFNQAIELASECLGNVKFIKEKKLIDRYFAEIAKDSGMYCFGVDDTFKALEIGAVDTLIVWENLDIIRFQVYDTEKNEKVLYLRKDQLDLSQAGVQYEIASQINLLEWLVDNYKNYGCQLEIVTDKTQEGSQYSKGFGGFGGILRYKMDFGANSVEDLEEFSGDFNEEDYM